MFLPFSCNVSGTFLKCYCIGGVSQSVNDDQTEDIELGILLLFLRKRVFEGEKVSVMSSFKIYC